MATQNDSRFERTARRAILPFRILEELGLSCGYERSFKMLPRKVLANRYLLGVNRLDLTNEGLTGICRRMKMPQPYQDALMDHLADANLVFLGFEDNEEAGCTYRVYLEYWDRLQMELRADPNRVEPSLLHLGFKWDAETGAQLAVSRYMCYPRITLEQILCRLSLIYDGQGDTVPSRVASGIVQLTDGKCADRSLVYLEVAEDNSSRRSFDINVYGANLLIRDIQTELLRLRQHYDVDSDAFRRLMDLASDKRFGHLSGGVNRHGEDFFTFYYEAEA